MTKVLIVVWLFTAACNHNEDIEQRKLAARQKMEEKVRSVIDELKADCDNTIMTVARKKADSIINKKAEQAKRKSR